MLATLRPLNPKPNALPMPPLRAEPLPEATDTHEPQPTAEQQQEEKRATEPTPAAKAKASLKRPAAAIAVSAAAEATEAALTARIIAKFVTSEVKGDRSVHNFKSLAFHKARKEAASDGCPKDLVDRIGRAVYRAAADQYASL